MEKALRLALEALESNRRTHHYCEDTWYSCPKHEDGCANDSEGDECNCGADEANAGIDQAITAIKAALEAKDEPVQDSVNLYQALTDPENQPNQYGVEFGMHGEKMMFKIGEQQFALDYEPDTQDEFIFMRDMLIHAFSTFTHGVKTPPTTAHMGRA
jgi:hypothetical protein